jgi:hypothetical protein
MPSVVLEVRIRFMLEKEANQLLMALAGGDVEGSVQVLVGGVHGLGVRVQDPKDGCFVSFPDRHQNALASRHSLGTSQSGQGKDA